MAKFLARRRHALYDTMLRVNHSGELAADRIYMGQMYSLRNDPKYSPMIQEMWNEEKKHLEYFSKQILLQRTSKSLLTPIWDVAGTVLGVTTGFLGVRTAMACTVAVEDTISKHYDSQIRELIADDTQEHKELIENLSKIRNDEQEHHDIGIVNEAENAFAYNFVSGIIANGCKIAIQIAQKI